MAPQQHIHPHSEVPEPGPKKPAPGELELVRAFVNTIDVEMGTENLLSASALAGWLRRHELIDATTTVSARDLRGALELREALRALLLHNNGDTLEGDPIATLDGYAARSRLAVCFDASVPPSFRSHASGVDGAFGKLIAIIATAMSEGTWERLKICRSDTCAWAFYDWSKNHSGAWCSMKVCGNRAKVRSYRRRANAAGRPAKREARSSS